MNGRTLDTTVCIYPLIPRLTGDKQIPPKMAKKRIGETTAPTHVIPGKATLTTDLGSPRDHKKGEPSRHRQTRTEMNTETNGLWRLVRDGCETGARRLRGTSETAAERL